jgi:hypothetical protein
MPRGRPRKNPTGTKLIAKGSKLQTAPVKAASKKQVATLTQRRRGRPPQSDSIKNRSARPGISITVQIPQLRRSGGSPGEAIENNKSPRLKLLFTGIAVVIVTAVAAGSYYGLRLHGHKVLNPAVAEAAAKVRTEPNYEPLIPSDTETTTKSYDGQKNVVAYNTTFSEARVTVSQQPLPANFPNDPSALLRAADSINAKKRVDTIKGPIFIATSDIDKSQMGLFASKTVLVFIHTDKTLDDVSWKSFIELLTQKSWQDLNKKSD